MARGSAHDDDDSDDEVKQPACYAFFTLSQPAKDGASGEMPAPKPKVLPRADKAAAVGTDAIGEARARQDEAIKKIQEGKLKREQERHAREHREEELMRERERAAKQARKEEEEAEAERLIRDLPMFRLGTKVVISSTESSAEDDDTGSSSESGPSTHSAASPLHQSKKSRKSAAAAGKPRGTTSRKPPRAELKRKSAKKQKPTPEASLVSLDEGPQETPAEGETWEARMAKLRESEGNDAPVELPFVPARIRRPTNLLQQAVLNTPPGQSCWMLTQLPGALPFDELLDKPATVGRVVVYNNEVKVVLDDDKYYTLSPNVPSSSLVMAVDIDTSAMELRRVATRKPLLAATLVPDVEHHLARLAPPLPWNAKFVERSTEESEVRRCDAEDVRQLCERRPLSGEPCTLMTWDEMKTAAVGDWMACLPKELRKRYHTDDAEEVAAQPHQQQQQLLPGEDAADEPLRPARKHARVDEADEPGSDVEVVESGHGDEADDDAHAVVGDDEDDDGDGDDDDDDEDDEDDD